MAGNFTKEYQIAKNFNDNFPAGASAMTRRREDYQELSRIGVPQRLVDVDDNVFVADNDLLQTTMRPNFRKQPWVPRANEYKARLDLYTGQYQRSSKKEQAPLFDLFKEDYLPDRNNIMNQVNNQAGRFRDETSNKTKNFEIPIDSIKVPPGLDIGYTAEPTNRPFHEWWRQREYTRDELTGIVRPSFELDRTDGALMGDGGILRPDYEKKRPETVYGVPQGTVLNNIFGAIVKPIQNAGKLVEKMVNRGTASNKHGTATGMAKEGMKPGNYMVDKEREEIRVRRDPNNCSGAMNLTGREADYTAIDRTAGLDVPVPKKIEYIENNRPDAPNAMVGMKANNSYTPGHVSKTPMHNDYINSERDKAGASTEIKAPGMYNPTINPTKHSEYMIQNHSGLASVPIGDSRNDKSMSVARDPMRLEYMEGRPVGAPTGRGKATVYGNVKARNTKKENVGEYTGNAGSTEIGASTFKSRQNIEARNKKHSSVTFNRIEPQQRPQSFTRPESGFLVNTRTNKKLLIKDGMGKYTTKRTPGVRTETDLKNPSGHLGYVGDTRVALNRFADDPGPLPWPDPTDFRFSPQYSWQVRDPAGYRRNPGPPVTNAMRPRKLHVNNYGRDDANVRIAPRMQFKPGNFNS